MAAQAGGFREIADRGSAIIGQGINQGGLANARLTHQDAGLAAQAFDDDIAAVVGYLNQNYYKFTR